MPLSCQKKPKLTPPNPPPQYFSGLVDEWWSKKNNSISNSHNRYLCRLNCSSCTVEGAEPSLAPDFEHRETPSKDPPPAQPTTGNNPTLQYG